MHGSITNSDTAHPIEFDLQPGALFGEMSLLTGLPRSATMTAVTNCELLEFDRGRLHASARPAGGDPAGALRSGGRPGGEERRVAGETEGLGRACRRNWLATASCIASNACWANGEVDEHA